MSDFKESVNKINANINVVADQLRNHATTTVEVRERLQHLEQVVARNDASGVSGRELRCNNLAGSAVMMFSEMPQFQEAANAIRSGVQPGLFRARVTVDGGIRAAITNVDLGQVGDTSIQGVRDRRRGIVTKPTPQLRLLDLLPSRRVEGNEVEFIQLSVTGDAGEQAKEGDTKSELEFDGTLVTAKIATVAAYGKASRQILSDQPALASVVDRLMRYKVLTKLENLIVNGNGVTSKINGLLNQATTFVPSILPAGNMADFIGEAARSLTSSGYAPSAILLNPRDWYRIQTLKTDTTSDYILGSPNVPISSSLWNIPVVVTTSIPEDTGVVLDTSFTTILDRWQTQVMISTENEDDFIKNMISILCELRAGLEVTDPLSIMKFDFGNIA